MSTRPSHNNSNINNNNRQICDFFNKIGACRHGDKCVRSHLRPKRSNTVVFLKMYSNPKYILGLKTPDWKHTPHQQQLIKNETESSQYKRTGEVIDGSLNEDDIQLKIDTLYQDLFTELSLKYGEIKNLVICENVNNHLSGNVYVTFQEDRSAAKCFKECNDRWFDQRPCFVELSPVRDIDDATCRSYEKDRCDRGGLCNFMHVRKPTRSLERKLFESQKKYYQEDH